MTDEQTKEQFLLAYNSNAYLNMCESDDMHNAIIALEKQIPKKPYLKDLWELGTMQGTVCPNCETILITAREKYCKHCGQALDWSDSE